MPQFKLYNALVIKVRIDGYVFTMSEVKGVHKEKLWLRKSQLIASCLTYKTSHCDDAEAAE